MSDENHLEFPELAAPPSTPEATRVMAARIAQLSDQLARLRTGLATLTGRDATEDVDVLFASVCQMIETLATAALMARDALQAASGELFDRACCRTVACGDPGGELRCTSDGCRQPYLRALAKIDAEEELLR